jgi:penicillin-binding protein 1C
MSLNIPAVALLDRVGALRFSSALKAAGTPMRLPRGADPALPLALGGAGTTLRELTALYATLGAGGEAAPLRTTCPIAACGAPDATTRVIESRAAQAVGAILVQTFPGGGPYGIAWKTGTSWGGRDAWAMGFDARHAVGVWVGRPDATPMPGATGRALALPVLARVFALLPAAPREGMTVRAVAGTQDGPADRLRLLFPPPGAVLAEEGGSVTIRVAGGRRPLTFLVDGAPIPHEPARRETSWTPEGPGFYRVTVLDADGFAVRAEVRIRPGP